jgi:hypothetical protein
MHRPELYYSSDATLLNVCEICDPSVETLPIMTTAISAAINAYSIAVTALSAELKRFNRRRTTDKLLDKLTIIPMLLNQRIGR